MKLNKLAAASALVFAGLSGQAMATLNAGDTTPFVAAATPAIDVYLSGASAPQNILGALAATLFGANTNSTTFNNYFILYDNAVSGAVGASYRAYQGRLIQNFTINGNTLTAGTMVRLTDRAKGGSVWGVNPLGRSMSVYVSSEVRPAGSTDPNLAVASALGQSKGLVAWMPITAANCTAAPAGSDHGYRCGEQGNDDAKHPNGNVFPSRYIDGRLPDFGVSDVEPRMFKDPLNVEFGQTALENPAVLTPFAVSGLLFGVAATPTVPTAINFNRAILSGLLSGDITDWTTLDSTLGGNTQVVICRRVQGSGTQATFNAYANNFPCGTASLYGSGSTTPLRMSDSAGYDDSVAGTITVDPSLGLTVIENPSSGNVRTCLQRANAGGVHSFTSDDGRAVTVNFGAGGYRAIGNLSFDSAPTADWSFRTLSGVVGDKANMRSGAYDFWSELSMQYHPTIYSAFPPNKRTFIDLFINRAGDPAVLNAISSTQLRNATAALPISYVPDEVTATGQNVTRVTRFGNSCSPLRRVY